MYREDGDAAMAIVNYTQAIKFNPDDDESYFLRAEMYEQVRNIQQIISYSSPKSVSNCNSYAVGPWKN